MRVTYHTQAVLSEELAVRVTKALTYYNIRERKIYSRWSVLTLELLRTEEGPAVP